MKLSQKNIIRLIIAAVAAIYNIVLFIITSDVEKTPVFWISYAFIMGTIVLFAIITFVPSPHTSGTRLVFGIPLLEIVATYAALEFAVGTLFMFLQM